MKTFKEFADGKDYESQMGTMSPADWHKYDAGRRERISRARSARLRGGILNKVEPEPPKIPRPKKVQLLDAEGGYVGTYDWGVTPDEAIEDATALGEKGPFKVIWVDA